MSRVKSRQLVFDEQISPVVAVQVRERGREAVSVIDLQLQGLKDWQIIPRLADMFDDWVLVTLDDEMPKTWGSLIRKHSVTVAVVRRAALLGILYEERKRDILHRWAHAFQAQRPGSVREYDARGSAPWKWRSRSKVPKVPGFKVPRGLR